MAKHNTQQTNFSNGQISAKAQGRFDVKEYSESTDLQENLITMPAGGVTKRAGTLYLAELGAEFALIPFSSSKGEKYLIGLNPLADSNADSIKIVYGSYNSLVFFNALDPSGTKNPFYRSLGRTAAGDWVRATGLDLNGFDYTQVGDVLTLTHSSGNLAPLAIIRDASDPTASPNFLVESIVQPAGVPTTKGEESLSSLAPYVRVPYLDANIESGVLLLASAVSGNITITAQDAGGTPISYFDEDLMGGTYFRIVNGTVEGVVEVTDWVSSSVVNGIVRVNIGATPPVATTNWTESAWGRHGFPKFSCYFEERMIYSATKKQPDVVFGSRTGNVYYMMERRLLGSTEETDMLALDASYKKILASGGEYLVTDPWQFRIGSGPVNTIQWMTSKDSILMGTLTGEFIMDGTDLPLSRTAVRIKRQTAYGSSPVRPVQLDDDLVFVSRDGKKLRTFRFARENGSFVSTDLNFFAEDVVLHGVDDDAYNLVQIKQLDHNPSRNIVWCRTDRNQIIGITKNPMGNTTAWHVHTLGGVGVEVISVCSITNIGNTYERVYLCVKRTVNGVVKYYLEAFNMDFVQDKLTSVPRSPEDYPVYVDCATVFSSSPASATITGLSHLNGDAVYVLANGKHLGPYTVAAGQIIISEATSYAVIGYLYKWRLRSLKLNAGSLIGSALGSMQKIDRVALRLYKAVEFYIGTDSVTEKIDRRRLYIDSGFTYDQMFTGDYAARIPGDPALGVKILFESENVFPFSLLAMAYRGNTND